jgi:CYTH domain-containing protein
MPLEIERKFLVEKLPNLPIEPESVIHITQAYISESPEIRVRKNESLYPEHIFTTKVPSGDYRDENEIPINKQMYEVLANQSTNVLSKNRFKYWLNFSENQCAEVDLYLGSLYGLMTVEVQFGTEEKASAFTPPAWFGAEVTHDDRYKNVNLNKGLWREGEPVA